MKRRIAGLLMICWTLLLATCGPGSSTEVRRTVSEPTVTTTPPVTATSTPDPTATAGDVAPSVAMPVPESLLVNQNCITCHAVHPLEVVEMPHEAHPNCNVCHRGSPIRITCQSCHSMHRVEIENPEHPNEPDIPCERCHTDGVPPTPAP